MTCSRVCANVLGTVVASAIYLQGATTLIPEALAVLRQYPETAEETFNVFMLVSTVVGVGAVLCGPVVIRVAEPVFRRFGA